MKRIFTTVVLSLVVYVASAQQDPQWSQNMFNKLAVNPGYAGSNNGICGVLLGRHQWMGFDGKPETYLLSVEGTVDAIKGGVGLTVMKDKLGVQGNLAAKLAYAYRMDLGSGKLGIGVDVGISSQSVDGSQLTPVEANDPNIPTAKESAIAPDLGFGVYYNTDKLYFGIAGTHLIGGKLDLSGVEYNIARHYYALAGYDYEINPNFTLRPSVFIKTDAASTQLDINVNLLYKKTVWGGVSYRLDDAVVAMAGVQFGEFRVGYAYDINTSALNNYNSGTHEIMLGYCFKLDKPTNNQRYKNVRYL